jgi:thermitase
MGKLRYPAIALVLAMAAFLAYPGIVTNEAVLSDDGDSINRISTVNTVYFEEDSDLAQRWGVSKIEAPQAWQVTQGDESIIVAVLDTGIDKNHQDLAGRVIIEVNFSDSPTCNDIYGHGTHTAGTIAAIAPGCRLMNVKVCDDVGRCEASVVAQGIIWAVNRGAKVINISLGVKSSPDLEEAINYAWSQGAVIVAAAGNEGKSTPDYPAYYANCLAVAATNANDSLALLSNHGDWVDVAAPGFNIYSTLPQNQYGYKGGTSSAAAHVSGEAALVFSVAKDTNGNGAINDEVRQAIESSCSPVSASGVGEGRIDAFEAVTEAIFPN